MTILEEYARTLNRQPSVNPDTLQAYEFPPALLARVQKEQGWTPTFTTFAVDEYLRFVQLAATAPHPVTPSQTIDEVWHTHLMFTRDYWERFMPLLPAPLHHEPGDGTPGSDAHFAAQYARTLDLYRDTFGQEPPPEVWPDPSSQSVPQNNAVQEKSRRWPFPVAALLGVGVFLTLHSAFLAFFILVLAVILLTSFNGARGSGGAGASCGAGGIFVGLFDSGSSDSGGSDSGDCGGGDGGSSCGSGCGGGCGS